MSGPVIDGMYGTLSETDAPSTKAGLHVVEAQQVMRDHNNQLVKHGRPPLIQFSFKKNHGRPALQTTLTTNASNDWTPRREENVEARNLKPNTWALCNNSP